MTSDDYNRLLNVSRALVGVAAFAGPGQVFRGAGIDERRNPNLPFVTRMFGVRDLVLGAGALSTSGDERRRWLQATVVADVGDLVAAVIAGRSGHLPRHGAIMLGLTAGTGTALGIAALVTGD